jgi:hypothetical protein
VNGHMTYADAEGQKATGGVSASQLKNFAFSNGHSFSLKLLKSYELTEMTLHGLQPGKEIKKFVKEQMFETESKDAIIIVYHGTRNESFSHAATFVRVLFNGKKKQVHLLDCKNKSPVICFGRDDTLQSDFPVLDVKDDIQDKFDIYYKWDLYSIEPRFFSDEIHRRDIENDIQFILTGDRKNLQAKKSLGGKKSKETLRMRMEKVSKGKGGPCKKSKLKN